MKEKKIKTSIDFNPEVMELLRSSSEKNGTSLGTEVNNIISDTLGLSHNVSFLLAQKIFELRHEINHEYNENEMINKEKEEKDMERLKNLEKLFNHNKENLEDNNMKKIEFNRGYCIVPEDWLVLDYEKDADTVYPCVIEVKNASKYEKSLGTIPHVLFFLSCPLNKMSEEKEKYILDAVCNICPAFNNIRAMQVKPMYDSNKVMLNEDLYLLAPIIGFFGIPEYGDPYSSFPYDAMFVRKIS